MAKTREVPSRLRAFNELFEEFTMRYDWGRSYCDYITWAATAHAFRAAGINDAWLDKRNADAVSRYGEKELPLLHQMHHAMTNALADEIAAVGWGDQLGHFYEVIASEHKSSWLGQFFTPHSLCSLIAGMQMDGQMDRPIVNDPACGSGRLMLAHHALAPTNRGYYVGCDVDPICCDMTAINMMMHGMEGEVIEMDTLRMQFRRGWRINPWLHSMDIVCIVPILTPRHSYMFGGNPLMFLNWKDRAEQLACEPRPLPPLPPVVPAQPAAKPQAQFNMQLKFDF